MKFIDRLQHGWNAFINNKDPTFRPGPSYSYRPDRARFTRGNERSIVTSIFNRIAMDASSIDIEHVRVDKDGRFTGIIDSGLNNCLTLEANIDQTGRAFMQDAVMSMLDEGVVALVPIDTTLDINTNSFDVETIRVGKIMEWYPQHIKVRVYDENSGTKKDVVVPKRSVAVIENPFYSVINEHNSTMQRLIRKLNLLDAIDEQSGSGKLDLIIQLPYVLKGEQRIKNAEDRRSTLERQLNNSKLGIGYIDSAEHVIQLNRSLDNNLMKQIEYLQNMLYSQLGITQSILDGTADEKTMLNYFSRTIEPIVFAIACEMRRKFLSKTARTQGQSIFYFRDPFKLVPVTELADIADKLTRNEIASSNEMRQKIGWKPSTDPKADELRNKNLSAPNEESQSLNKEQYYEEENQNG
ncbi:phage portal protein [bacterium TM223]|uniref:phage portal protein n=1 Tax=Faecalibacillus intestinalis TaxID=1982626 RepID=UPI00210A2F36|nr:phage portal protein [Faecalibacillus intestinalis]MCB7553092.1 phage portal protein [bacterium TM223]MCQ4766077.1 phage portal protein [Faecalibacillus intestinalis]